SPPSTQGAAVHLQSGPVVMLLGVHGEAAELGRLRQPALTGLGEAEGSGIPLPRQRHAAAVAAGHAGALVRRVLAQLIRDVADLWQAQLLALVEVSRSGQSEHHEAHRAGSSLPELSVRALVAGEPLAEPIVRRESVAGGVADEVV